MAENINTWLEKILYARYGEEVRGAIYNSIKVFNTTLNDTASKFNQDAAAVAQAKTDTINAMNTAVSAKNSAVSASQSAAQSADVANRYQTAALGYANQAEAAKTAAEKAKTDTIAAKTDAINAINSTKTSAITAITTQQTTSINAVKSQESTSKQAVVTQQTASIKAVNDAKDEALRDIGDAADDILNGDLYVKKTGDAISGVVTAPTPTNTSNVKQIVNKEYVDSIEITKSGIGNGTIGWYKVAECYPSKTNGFTDYYGVFLVQQTAFDNLTSFGILRAHIRVDNYSSNKRIENAQLYFDYTGLGIVVNEIILTYKTPSDPITIYCKTPGTNRSYKLTLIQDNMTVNQDNKNLTAWTMFDNSPMLASLPSDYTQVVSSYSPTNHGDIHLPLFGSNHSRYLYLHGNEGLVLRLCANQRTENNVKWPRFIFEGSNDNGATWQPYGKIMYPGQSIEGSDYLPTVGVADGRYVTKSVNTFIVRTWYQWNASTLTGYYKIATSTQLFNSNSGNSVIRIKGSACGWSNPNLFEIVICNRGANNGTHFVHVNKIGPINTDCPDILLYTNADGYDEIYVSKNNTNNKWMNLYLEIAVTMPARQWTVHKSVDGALSSSDFISGTIPGTKVWSLQEHWNDDDGNNASVVADNDGAHNSIFRGKNLGSSITTAQNTAIKNGTFEDMYVGDYWVINGVNWRIAGFNLCQDEASTPVNHVVIVPDSIAPLSYTINSSNTKYYGQTAMHTTYMPTNIFQNWINSVFDPNTNRYMKFLVCSFIEVSGAVTLKNELVYCESLSEIQLYGTHKLGTSAPDIYPSNALSPNYLKSEPDSQFPLFRLCPSLIAINNNFWLRDVYAPSTYWCYQSSNSFGYEQAQSGSSSSGARPYFCIKGV